MSRSRRAAPQRRCETTVTVRTHQAFDPTTCPSWAERSKRSARLNSQRSRLGRRVLFPFLLLLASTFLASDPAAAPFAGSYCGADAAAVYDEEEQQPLLLTEISRLKVRELKRRLALQHGYSADEIARMIDKKDLVEALAYEEHRLDVKRAGERKRRRVKHSIMVALAAVALVMFWPLIRHLWEIVSVNFVVYTDKKRYEFGRCRELQSPKGCFGLFLVSVMDALQLWLSVSVALSWVMRRNRYFFPTPNLPVRPGALLSGATGGTAGGGPLGQYGINVGPMIITWGLQWLRRKLESWLGRVLADAHRYQRTARREARGGDDGGKKKKKRTPEEKEARRAARAARRAEREAAREAEATFETTWDGSSSHADADGESNVAQDGHSQEDQAEGSSRANLDRSEMRKAAADAAEARRGRSGCTATEDDDAGDGQDATENSPANHTDFDELD